MRLTLALALALSWSAVQIVYGADCRTGTASYYGAAHHGKTTASGEPFDMDALTAAHKTLAFGTRLVVNNPANGRSVQVRITDRGPFVVGRVLDLSRAAMAALGGIKAGVIAVEYCEVQP